MNYAKAVAVGLATGVLAVVLQFVVGIGWAISGQAGGGGGIAGFSVDPVPGFIIGFVAGSVLMLWRARLRTQTR